MGINKNTDLHWLTTPTSNNCFFDFFVLTIKEIKLNFEKSHQINGFNFWRLLTNWTDNDFLSFQTINTSFHYFSNFLAFLPLSMFHAHSVILVPNLRYSFLVIRLNFNSYLKFYQAVRIKKFYFLLLEL